MPSCDQVDRSSSHGRGRELREKEVLLEMDPQLSTAVPTADGLTVWWKTMFCLLKNTTLEQKEKLGGINLYLKNDN